MLKSRGASERPFGELGTPAPPPARSARSRRALLSSGRTLQAPPAPARSPGAAPPSRVKANLTAAPSAPARASRRGSLQPAAPSVARGACARGLRVRRSLMHAGPRAGRVVPSRRVQPRPPPVRGLVRGQRAPPRPTRLRTRERAPLSATLIRSSARVAPGRQRGGGAGVLRRLGAAGDRQRLAAAPHQSGPRGRGPLRPSLVRQCVPSDLTKEALPCG